VLRHVGERLERVIGGESDELGEIECWVFGVHP
jgi:hypothetical protein